MVPLASTYEAHVSSSSLGTGVGVVVGGVCVGSEVTTSVGSGVGRTIGARVGGGVMDTAGDGVGGGASPARDNGAHSKGATRSRGVFTYAQYIKQPAETIIPLIARLK